MQILILCFLSFLTVPIGPYPLGAPRVARLKAICAIPDSLIHRKIVSCQGLFDRAENISLSDRGNIADRIMPLINDIRADIMLICHPDCPRSLTHGTCTKFVQLSSDLGPPSSKDVILAHHTINLYDHTSSCDHSARSSFSVSSLASSGASALKPCD